LPSCVLLPDVKLLHGDLSLGILLERNIPMARSQYWGGEDSSYRPDIPVAAVPTLRNKAAIVDGRKRLIVL